MKATETTVLKFIGGEDKVFIIPPFQRNYEWSEEQCKELFNDIKSAYKQNKTHYLGNILYYIGDNNSASFDEFILVDGQQRITTILLLLCAIRDISDDEDLKKVINRKYLKNEDSIETFKVKLKQTSYDEDIFISVVEGDISNVLKESNIYKNYDLFLKLLEESDVSPKDIYETIPKLEVVDVNLSAGNQSINLEAVQTVFEKINSTGKKLTPADLIRNYLLLANSSKEQEKLYKQYWVKIEQTVKNENISRFARDYLVMNTFDDVPEDSIYKNFKEHFSEISHLDILSELSSLSKYFSWLIFENSPNEEINHIVSYLNLLKTDDVYPLYLYLFAKLYDNNTAELKNILELLSDFMLRYRIVSPSGGGGALRAVIHQLLEKLNSEEIQISYENILFELSNSNTIAGHYPDDKEFKEALMYSNNLNYRYARVVLLKIEESEKKNIKVAAKDVTIEHLMPQKLSEWWIEYLGGKESAETIYEKYINCIGNLTPMSAEYNSKNSNSSWDKKLNQIKDIQFVITSEIYSNKEWKEKDIAKRNNDIAERACKATTSPLQRTRQYQTKGVSEEFIEGLYPINDITTPMSGTHITAIIYDDNVTTVSSWNEFLKTICEVAYDLDDNIMKKIVRENSIHKATSTRNYPDKDPIITNNPSLLLGPKEIKKDSGIFIEGCISSNRARFYAKQILDIYGLADEFQIQVEK